MIARATTFGIIAAVGFIVWACGPSRSRPRPPPPDPGDTAGTAGDAGDIAAPVVDASAPSDTPLPSERVWLKPMKVSWPTDRWPAQFHALGGDTAFSAAWAVSGDGSTPVGFAAPTNGDLEPVRWRDGVMEPLAMPAADVDSRGEARAASFDGEVVAGRVTRRGDDSSPMVWRQGDPPRRLRVPEGRNEAEVLGLSRDGTIAIGCSGKNCDEPVRWLGDHPSPIEGTRPFTLGPHPVTTDGKIVVGAAGTVAARLEGKSVIRKGADSFATSISDDGKVMVGSAGKDAVIWRGKKPSVLGRLPGHDACRAVAVSADAGRVVGNCTRTVGGQHASTAWVWDAKHGMRSVADALAAAKITTIGWSLDEVLDICSFGVTLVGHGQGPRGLGSEAWMAIVPRWP